MDDQRLLRQFIETGNDEAFNQLVSRHVHWVNSMAQRMLNDRALADDVTQTVFALLARKAHSLRNQTMLSRWLFSTTRFTALCALREKTRRLKHERIAAAMRSESQLSEWSELSPQLDELVSRLRLGDREAVLLRFYEQKTFPEIGQHFSITEEAARKRVERAIDQLRRLFARKGVTVATATLAILLAENLTHPAAAAVVASAVAGKTAAAPIATKSGSALLAWLTAKTVVTASLATVVTVAATTTVIQVASSAPSPTTAPATMPAPAAQADGFDGMVLSPQGSAMPDAQVMLVKWGRRPHLDTTTKTDSAGHFRLPLNENFNYFTVYAPGYGLTGKTVDHPGRNDPIQIQLTAATELHIKLVDPEGKPAAGVSVAPRFVEVESQWSCIVPKELQDQLVRTSDASGLLVLPNLPRHGQVVLTMRDDRYAQFPSYPPINLADADISDGGTYHLQKTASVSGKIVYADTGKPAADVGLDIYQRPGDFDEPTETDADGVFHFKQLPQGSYHLEVDVAYNNLQQNYTIGTFGTAQVQPADAVTGQDFALIKGGIVQGKITAQQTGQPMGGVIVGFLGQQLHQTIVTAADGSYMMHVPPSRQNVQILGEIPMGFTEPKNNFIQLNVVENQTLTANFQLPATPGVMIKGKTVDPDGKPINDVILFGQDKSYEDPQHEPKITSDSHGEFSIRIVKGGTLHAHKDKWSITEPIVINDAADNFNVVLHNDAMSSMLVHVQQADGTAIPGAKIEFYEQHGNEGDGQGAVTTKSDGSAVVESLYPDMQYELNVTVKNFGQAWSNHLKLQAGKQLELPPIVLVKADSFIAGLVINEQGDPMPGVKFNISGGQTMQQEGTSDDSGHFNFSSIVAGEKIRVYPSYAQDEQYEIVGPPPSIAAGTNDAIITVRKRQGG